ncbi:hypothetical protein EVAR_39733_1 [Eumeta japonica]|uniref:Uncharacterized protein n=1 Tax=Eumeta variegata TaxID=151549 RepID=A0A4C1W867_EUMVA|nr:hypothetical protein EVAR_39733_1 [Eumeta japonica]
MPTKTHPVQFVVYDPTELSLRGPDSHLAGFSKRVAESMVGHALHTADGSTSDASSRSDKSDVMAEHREYLPRPLSRPQMPVEL